jgi:hypothetical protein
VLVLRGLTFELTGSQRQDARPDGRMICPAARRAWRPAVGAPVERGVRQRRAAHVPVLKRPKASWSWWRANIAPRSALASLVRLEFKRPHQRRVARRLNAASGSPTN